jgi:hypothetical protein
LQERISVAVKNNKLSNYRGILNFASDSFDTQDSTNFSENTLHEVIKHCVLISVLIYFYFVFAIF